MYGCIHTCICMDMNRSTYMLINVYLHTYLYACIHATYIQTSIHTYMYIHINIQVYLYTYNTYAYVCINKYIGVKVITGEI